MEIQELIDFLRENLSISLTTDRSYDFGHEYVNIDVTLNLNIENETIILSQDSDSFSINQ